MADGMPRSARIDELRQILVQREPTMEECREIVAIVREGRVAAAQTSAASRSRKAPVDTASLQDEIDNL